MLHYLCWTQWHAHSLAYPCKPLTPATDIKWWLHLLGKQKGHNPSRLTFSLGAQWGCEAPFHIWNFIKYKINTLFRKYVLSTSFSFCYTAGDAEFTVVGSICIPSSCTLHCSNCSSNIDCNIKLSLHIDFNPLYIWINQEKKLLQK